MGFKPVTFEIGKAPHELMLELQKKYQVKNFVETGTYLGETTEWASRHFEKVYTFEAAEKIYQSTKNKLGSIPNIGFIFGESNKELTKIHLDGPAIFWLDAHYSSGDTFNGEVPLLEELAIINAWDIETFIFIDDARLILSKWQDIQYCDLALLIQTLSVKNRYIAIADDIIMAVPYDAKETVNNYTQKISETYWNRFLADIQTNGKKPLSKIFGKIKAKLKIS